MLYHLLRPSPDSVWKGAGSPSNRTEKELNNMKITGETQLSSVRSLELEFVSSMLWNLIHGYISLLHQVFTQN